MCRMKGIGLLELMLSLAIIALVMIMAARYFTIVQEQQKITQTTQMGTNLLQAAYTWNAGQTSFPYGRVFNNDLVKAGLLSPAYCEKAEAGTPCVAGGSWPWGMITVEGRESSPGISHHLAFKAYGIPGGTTGPICQMLQDRIKNNIASGVGGITDFLCP